MNFSWYPLRFEPLYERRGWGGALLERALQRAPPAPARPCGVCWELVDGPAGRSRVANGPLAGRLLADLVRHYGGSLVGARQDPQAPFPVQVRYCDVGRGWPLLVYPTAEIRRDWAAAPPGQVAWYLAAVTPGSTVAAGIGTRATQQQFHSRLGSADLASQLQVFPAFTGDAYYMPPGRPFALGGGVLAYCVETAGADPLVVDLLDADAGDWQVHPQAVATISFTDRVVNRVRRDDTVVPRNRKAPIVSLSSVFTMDEIRLVTDLHDRVDPRSFHLLTTVMGGVRVQSGDAVETLAPGDSCLLPACLGQYQLTPLAASAVVVRTMLRTS